MKCYLRLCWSESGLRPICWNGRQDGLTPAARQLRLPATDISHETIVSDLYSYSSHRLHLMIELPSGIWPPPVHSSIRNTHRSITGPYRHRKATLIRSFHS